MTSAYQQQLVQQLRAAEDELGRRRRQVAELADDLTALRARVIRTRTAWWSACRRATDHRSSHETYQAAAERWANDLARIGHGQMERAEQAEARIAAVRALHQPVDHGGWQVCTGCSRPGHVTAAWPCPTITALDRANEDRFAVDNPRNTGWYWTRKTCHASSGKFSTDDQALWRAPQQHPQCPSDPNGPWTWTTDPDRAAFAAGCPSTFEALYPDRHVVTCGLPAGHLGQHFTADRKLTWHEHQPTEACPCYEGTAATAVPQASCPSCLWPVHHGITCQENAAILRSAAETP